MSKIIRAEKKQEYTVLDRGFLNDARLSWKAKGILAYMLSMPDDWFFYIDELKKHASDGDKSFRSGFNELKSYGYVKRFPVYVDKRIAKWETIVYEVPQNVQVGNQNPSSIDLDNEGLLNTDFKLNTELLNTDKKILPEFAIPYKSIVDYLNEKAGTSYRYTSKKTRQLIRARFQEGFTEDDFQTVIIKKVCSWLHDEKMNKFLRPETLFGTKFESYLNEKVGGQHAKIKRNQTTTQFTDGINF
ncbi:uncharacterized phage protein (TIGR02220 family) [Ureibacillus xyleni]|uniref:Uncharacterized phage protein (TIGR02220 family) n=1 Tax=Ureibacillus xyleni TaxID=614648 RepID=A0A285SEK8_9BACL|nr:conserved phage C-terminal domain-containing protein [Ureibacillus xyleni]SOC06352.1 uncharacterized phage protein (TIGR02220 family) [Ureibacillus xyleni]